MSILRAIIFNLLICLLCSCKHSSAENDNSEESQENHRSAKSSSDNADTDSKCAIEDGTHSATIDSYNPDTRHSATYTLDVEVKDCQVVQIDFNNGGYLDGDHIDPADIDENGDASVEDDQGRSFEVHIEE